MLEEDPHFPQVHYKVVICAIAFMVWIPLISTFNGDGELLVMISPCEDSSPCPRISPIEQTSRHIVS